jgi:hypothetical protein
MKLRNIPPVVTEPVDKQANFGSNPTTCLTKIDQAIIECVRKVAVYLGYGM